ncbi:MAG: restriction endonuclease [Rhodospirillales bacterium]
MLDRVRSGTPAFFEQIVVDLLLAMGYGGSSDNPGRTLGKSGDGGVDGVIDQDALGIDQIYIQAKRWKDGNKVGVGEVNGFAGALDRKKAQKGILITASSFTEDAEKAVKEMSSRIVLIDGDELARLMIRYEVGCRKEDTLHLKKIDEDFFDDGE